MIGVFLVLGCLLFALGAMEIANIWDHRQDRKWTYEDQLQYELICDKWKEDHS
jgi:hypothetical protein